MDGVIQPSGTIPGGAEDAPTVESLPKEAGIFLMMIGLGGVLLPGPVGTPFLILGVVVFFPALYQKVDRGLAKRFPKSHREGMKQVRRFVGDLERRYPSPS